VLTIVWECTEYIRWLADPRGEFGPMGPLMLVSFVISLVRRRTDATTLWLCLLVPGLLYLSLGSTDLTRYRPVIHQPRYLVPLLPALALLTVEILRAAWSRRPNTRRAMVALGLMVLGSLLVAPNGMSGRWYQARTLAAGQAIMDRWTSDSTAPRLCAAGLTGSRFEILSRWLDYPPIEMIWTCPATPEDWVAKYGGACVLVSRSDTHGPSRDKHRLLSLNGQSYDALRTFCLVDREEPAASRLHSLTTRVLGRVTPTDPDWAVELWAVPENLDSPYRPQLHGSEK
jgi:hypothetical protein